MARGQVLRAVLDANVIYSAFIRDVLLRLAGANLYHPHWTRRIHEEWIRNLARERPDLLRENLVRTSAAMDTRFPAAVVEDYEAFEEHLGGVAPEDRHVAAAALKAGAGTIITQNLRDFPAAALQPHGVVARHPDEFIRALTNTDPYTVRTVLETHRQGLQHPPLREEEYRAAFIRNGLQRSAALIWS